MNFHIWYWWNILINDKTAMITCSAAILTLVLFIWNMRKSMTTTTLPPGPRGLPIIGYLPFLGTHLHKTFTKLAEVYGPVYKLWLGNKLYVVVSSPSLAKEVLRDQDTTFSDRFAPVAAQVAFYNANDVFFNQYYPDWQKMRKIFATTLMSNASLDAGYPLRKHEVENTIKDLYNKIGMPINISEFSISTSINSLQKILWGGTVEVDIASEVRDFLDELLELLGAPNISDIFPLLSRFDIQGIERRARKIALRFDELINRVIEHHGNTTKEDERKNDFLHVLLELIDHEDGANSFTMTQLKAMILDIILAGLINIPTIMEWTLTELMLQPEIMKKVQEELAQIVGMDNIVEESHLPKLRYLDAVMKEVLRLHPPQTLLSRTGSERGTIGGYTIPKGSRIMLNVSAIHRDPKLWENPLEFKPDRFLDVDNIKFDYVGTDFQYMPFGSGRKGCPGIPLGKRMLMFFLTSLLHSFDWKLPCDADLDLFEKFGMVTKKANPLLIIPTPRLSDSKFYK